MVTPLGPFEKIVVSPFVGVVWGTVSGTLYTYLTHGMGVKIPPEQIFKNYIIWGIAEHALRSLAQAFFCAFNQEKNISLRIFADRSLLIISGIAGISTLFEKELMGNHLGDEGIYWLIGVVFCYCFYLYDYTLSPYLTDIKPVPVLLPVQDD